MKTRFAYKVFQICHNMPHFVTENATYATFWKWHAVSEPACHLQKSGICGMFSRKKRHFVAYLKKKLCINQVCRQRVDNLMQNIAQRKCESLDTTRIIVLLRVSCSAWLSSQDGILSESKEYAESFRKVFHWMSFSHLFTFIIWIFISGNSSFPATRNLEGVAFSITYVWLRRISNQMSFVFSRTHRPKIRTSFIPISIIECNISGIYVLIGTLSMILTPITRVDPQFTIATAIFP